MSSRAKILAVVYGIGLLIIMVMVCRYPIGK